MDLAREFQRSLEELDINSIRKLWSMVQPGLPQPKSDAEVLTGLHLARTQAQSIDFNKRAYSHSWLRERNFPSMLPDHLRPEAERLYPIIVTGVGIAVYALSKTNQPAALEIRREMETAVLDAYADNKTNPDFVKKRMSEARDKAKKRLFG